MLCSVVDVSKVDFNKAYGLMLTASPKAVNTETTRTASFLAFTSAVLGLGFGVGIASEPIDLVLVPFTVFMFVMAYGPIMLATVFCLNKALRLIRRAA